MVRPRISRPVVPGSAHLTHALNVEDVCAGALDPSGLMREAVKSPGDGGAGVAKVMARRYFAIQWRLHRRR